MKLMTILIILFAFWHVIAAPAPAGMVIFAPDEINYYEPLIRAVVRVESKGDIYAFNFIEQACGPMQIRPIRIDHFNRLTGSNYTTKDCFDMELSRKVFLYFARGKTYEKAAKDWNGSGEMTKEYWKRVQKHL